MRLTCLLFSLLLCGFCTRARAQTNPLTALDASLDVLDTLRREAPEEAIARIDSLLGRFPDLDSARLIRATRIKARARRLIGDYVTAIGEWRSVYAYATRQRDSLMLVEAADQIGMMNTYMGNYLEGQPYLLQVAEIYERIGDVEDRAGAANGLAILYNDLKRIDDAVAMYRRALALYEEAGDQLGQAAVHANLGMLFAGEGRFDLAETHLLEQGRIDSLEESKYGLAFYYDFMGELRKKQERYPEALELSRLGLALREELPSHYNVAESRNSVAGILLRLGRYEEAIGLSRAVLDRRDEHESLTQASTAYEYLSRAYEGLNDPARALTYHKRYKEVSDSIYQRDHLEEITTRDALYQKARQEEEIARLGQQNALSRVEIGRKNTALLAAGSGLVLISLFALVFWLLYRKINVQKAGLELLNRQKDTLLREIHHRVKNNLQMVSSLLSLQSEFIEDDAALDAIQMGQRRVRSMAIIHQKLYLRDEITTSVSARQYLDQLIGELMSTLNVSGIPLRMEKDLEDIELDIDRMIPLGLIANEVITNAMKYAFTGRKSGELNVGFRRVGAEVELCISDDGPGLNAAATVGNDSFGGLLIRTFTEQLDGRLEVDGAEGTSVRLRFPYVAV